MLRKIQIIFVTLALVMALIPGGVAAGGTTVIFNDFDDPGYVLTSEWSRRPSPGRDHTWFEIVEAEDINGDTSKMLKFGSRYGDRLLDPPVFYGSDTSANIQRDLYIRNNTSIDLTTGVTVVDFDFLTDNRIDNGASFWFSTPEKGSNRVMRPLRIGSGTQWLLGEYNPAAAFFDMKPVNVWCKIRLVAMPPAEPGALPSEIHFYLDGQYQGSYAPSADDTQAAFNPAACLFYIRINPNGNMAALMDNLRIWKPDLIPPAASVEDSESASVNQLTLNFDADMDLSTLNNETISIDGVPGDRYTIETDPLDLRSCVVNFSVPLMYAKDYTVSVDGARDQYGNVLTEWEGEFTTEDGPDFYTVFLGFSDGEGPALTLTAGDISAAVYASNNTGGDRSVSLIMALCEGTLNSYRISDIVLADASIETGGGDTIYTPEITVGADKVSGHFMRLFVWDGLSLKPLSQTYQLYP